MAWLPGWDREWLLTYMNEPLKNSNPLWNGCFAIPRKLRLDGGQLVQQPVPAMTQLRREHFQLAPKDLPVTNAFTATDVVKGFEGNQLEIHVTLDLQHASLCGINVLSDAGGQGGLPIVWHGDALNVDGVNIPMPDVGSDQSIRLQIFVDKKFVEIFVNGGKYCISRQVQEKNVKGEHIAFTSLGGTAKLVSFEGWRLAAVN
jgi:sucrose-6-phosphate hydrolase SacC (GH32 family)